MAVYGITNIKEVHPLQDITMMGTTCPQPTPISNTLPLTEEEANLTYPTKLRMATNLLDGINITK